MYLVKAQRQFGYVCVCICTYVCAYVCTQYYLVGKHCNFCSNIVIISPLSAFICITLIFYMLHVTVLSFVVMWWCCHGHCCYVRIQQLLNSWSTCCGSHHFVPVVLPISLPVCVRYVCVYVIHKLVATVSLHTVHFHMLSTHAQLLCHVNYVVHIQDATQQCLLSSQGIVPALLQMISSTSEQVRMYIYI